MTRGHTTSSQFSNTNEKKVTMYSLHTLRVINAKAARKAKVEDNFNRECSFCASKAGIVLHSALQRNTAFIAGATAKRFMAGWLSTNSTTKRNALVESYFNTAPLGKQTKAA